MRAKGVLLLTAGLIALLVACSSSKSTSTSTPSGSTPGATATGTSSTPAASPTPCSTSQVPGGAASGTAVPTIQATPTVTPDCLVVYDVVVGTGQQAKAGDTVTANYTGWLSDGSQFDASSAHGGAAQFGLANVIQGWQKGVPGMKVGGKRRLVIPADLAYGSKGAGSTIPPNSTLTFDIELVSIP